MPSKRGHLTYQVRKPMMKTPEITVFLKFKTSEITHLPLLLHGLLSGTAKPYIHQPTSMMKTKFTAFSFVLLLLLSPVISLIPTPGPTAQNSSHPLERHLEEAFVGFSTEPNQSVWNQSPWSAIAMPQGFDFLSVYDYSDVGVLINNNSEASRTIGWAFITARNISMERVFVFNNSSAPTKETINRDQFNTYFAEPFLEMIQNRSNASSINYLVTTKGMPLRINGGNDKASFDQELALVGGQYNSSVGADYWVDHDYGPLAGKSMEAFSRETYGFFLITRLTGYTVETALGLIEKANNSLGSRGVFALDLATNRNGSGYKFWNDDLYTANTTLNATLGLPTHFDETSEFLTNISNVMGYASWGSNDGGWASNSLPNGGFDTASSSTSSGSKFWEATLPTLSSGDSFNWTLQSSVKDGGSSAMEAAVAAECMPEAADGSPGIFAEFFDNDGVSFNTGSMPSLIDRVPDHIRIETELDYTSRYNAYPGLDNRFKNDWGARFSGLIDVPETGNWTFYLTSDDGSEFWLNDASLVTNYGSHGMREQSNSIILDEGLHDFRIEFFQGGGPHGLTLQWEGPNQTKAPIPSTSYQLAGDYIPSSNDLQHHWSFEDGSGSSANDSASGDHFTLYNMNASNWNACVDGGCLWYDGVDDYLEVDVQDWNGTFTISQWVWANASNLSNYASVFAAGAQAGSNASFQHAVFNGEWRLHNNQTHTFGAIRAQNWTHLVTVFENGVAEQYLDGVLVRTTAFPSGSVDTIESYRLGVNRAGSTYFEGKIDEVMIWDTALSDGEITSLNRDIYLDCAAYSGNGQAVASLQQTFAIDQELESHSWLASGKGMRTGDVFGSFEMVIEGLDSNGTVVSTNTSSDSSEFGTSWSSLTMRFEPHSDAIELRITIPLDLVATSTDGSVYLDSFNVYPIRPNHEWVNGSIAETAVSTGGRSFTTGTTYGQSLVADLLEDGASGVKGYVYEPYLTAVGLSSVLLSSYAGGYNLAEAHAAANLQSGWMGVTVGDPKMAPYADQFHDINIIDVRVPNNASYGVPTTVQLAIENRGMAEANGTLLIQDIQGNIVLFRGDLSLPAGDVTGSRTLLNVTITPQKVGWMDLRVRYDSSSNASERIMTNNLDTLRLWVNAPPTIDAVYCDATTYARGDSFICTVEATDDIEVLSVKIAWAVVTDPENLTSVPWIEQNLGALDSTKWQTSIILPTNLTLGTLVIGAYATDASQQTTHLLSDDVAEIVDAQAQWFGPSIEGVDAQAWSGATPLPYAPNGGFVRGQVTPIKACVLDADHDSSSENATILSSKGTVGAVSHQQQLDANHHCYLSTIYLEVGASLEKVSFEVRSPSGQLLSSRLIGVRDLAPEAQIDLVDANASPLDRVRGGGNEYLRVTFTDLDDPLSSVTGDLSIEWPGAAAAILPLDVPDIQNALMVELPALDQPLESGELIVSVDATGRHGATMEIEERFTFLLSPPLVLDSKICSDKGAVESLRFGETLTLYAVIESERPLETVQATMSQLGWAVAAPALTGDAAPALPPTCLLNETTQDELHRSLVTFRLRLDGSFIDGEGQIMLVVRDIDGLSSSEKISINLFHAAPSLSINLLSNATAGDRITPVAYVSDLDGLTDVECQSTVYGNDTYLANFTLSPQTDGLDALNGTLSYVYPTTQALGNTTLRFNFTCADGWGQENTTFVEVTLLPMPPCLDCNTSLTDSSEGQGVDLTQYWAIAGIVVVVLSLAITSFIRRSGREETPELWAVEEVGIEEVEAEGAGIELMEGSDIPAGWSPEAYLEWLEGEMPQGWQLEQWEEFVVQQMEYFTLESSDMAEKD